MLNILLDITGSEQSYLMCINEIFKVFIVTWLSLDWFRQVGNTGVNQVNLNFWYCILNPSSLHLRSLSDFLTLVPFTRVSTFELQDLQLFLSFIFRVSKSAALCGVFFLVFLC